MSTRADRIRELAQKEEPLTRVEREELAGLNGHTLGTEEEEQRKVEMVERLLAEPMCPMCPEPGIVIELGTLGHRTHFRCRNCGCEWSTVVDA